MQISNLLPNPYICHLANKILLVDLKTSQKFKYYNRNKTMKHTISKITFWSRNIM